MIYGGEIAYHDDHDGYIYNHSYLWNGYGIDIIFLLPYDMNIPLWYAPKSKIMSGKKKQAA